jgi:AcrR family transcriptional regulator
MAEASDSSRKPGLARRRQRISKEEAAERMLDVALDEIRANGLFVNMEHLNFEDVIRDAGVPRSAAYRNWESKELFFGDLFLKLLSTEVGGAHAFYRDTVLLVAKLALDKLDLLEDVAGRRRLFLEVCRIGSEQNYRIMFQSSEWQTYIAVAATLGSIEDGDLRAAAKQSLLTSEESFVTHMSGFYEAMASILGLHPRQGITFETMTVLGASIINGLALEGGILTTRIPGRVILADPFGTGELQEWSVPSLGYTAMIDGLCEFDPDHVVDKGEVRTLLEGILADPAFNDPGADDGKSPSAP